MVGSRLNSHTEKVNVSKGLSVAQCKAMLAIQESVSVSYVKKCGLKLLDENLRYKN